MSQEEVLRMVAKAKDDASGPLRKVEAALQGVGKRGREESKALREGFHRVHEQLGRVAEVAKTGVAPAIEAIGISSLSAVGAVAALVSGLKNFASQGDEVAAFGRKVQLTTDTIRGLEGVAEKFHVDPGAIRSGEQGFADAMFLIRRRRGELYAHLLAQRRDFATELAATPESTAGNEQALKSFLRVLEDVKRIHGEPTARAFSKEVFGTDAFVDLLRKGNAGLQEAIALTLQLRGAMDVEAAERWVGNWSDFKATIEGVRNAIGNELLPDLTELAKQGKDFFVEHKVEIGREIVDALRGMGSALREMKGDLPSIKEFFDDILIAVRGITAAWRFMKMTPGQIWDEMHGKQVPDEDIRLARPHMFDLPSVTSDYSRGGHEDRAAKVIKGLRERGLDPEHAAILAGNIEQESNFDPTLPNVAEGGIGLIQWRLERRKALQEFAARRHALETDMSTQLDFLMSELNTEGAGGDFKSATSMTGMNSALHRFIRYGDRSEVVRLANARKLLPLAERSAPGSLLAAAGKSGLNGGATSVTGSASIDVNVTAPKGTTVTADAAGLFDPVRVNRGIAMPLDNFED